MREVTHAHWRKSSHSGTGNNCVEVARLAVAVAVRDSKHPDGGALVLASSAWKSLTRQVKADAFDFDA